MNVIREKGLNRVVVAACTPKTHEPTFRYSLREGGINQYFFDMASIREHCSWVHSKEKEEATKKSKDIIRMSLARACHLEPLQDFDLRVNKAALVVGGGIAGIQAALQIANAGFHVYLVEREPSIGGHMAQFDKTFPTLDCSACILTPRMVEVGTHPNVTLLTWSEVEQVAGYVGNFQVTSRKKARFINEELCTGCGICAEKCPKKVIDEVFTNGWTDSG